MDDMDRIIAAPGQTWGKGKETLLKYNREYTPPFVMSVTLHYFLLRYFSHCFCSLWKFLVTN